MNDALIQTFTTLSTETENADELARYTELIP